MGTEPVEVIRAMIDAFEARDPVAFAALVTEDAPFYSKLASVDGVVYHGYQAAARYMQDIDSMFDDWRLEDVRCFAGTGNTALALYRVRATGKVSGAPVDTVLAMMWEIIDGLGRSGEVFTDTAAALERAGLTSADVDGRRGRRGT